MQMAVRRWVTGPMTAPVIHMWLWLLDEDCGGVGVGGGASVATLDVVDAGEISWVVPLAMDSWRRAGLLELEDVAGGIGVGVCDDTEMNVEFLLFAQ